MQSSLKMLPKTPTPLTSDESAFIHVKAGESLKENLAFIRNDSKDHSIHLNIIVEEEATLELIETYGGNGSYTTNVEMDIFLHRNAVLKHLKNQNESQECVHNNIVSIHQDKSSSYSSLLINKGSKNSHYNVRSILQGEFSTCTFKGINILKEKQKAKATIAIEHQVPNCESFQFYRSVLDDWSVGSFEGRVHVFKEGQKTFARQMSNALLLSPTATMFTRPELEIYADDVECNHGATTGQLDQEQLFYLRSRGIPENVAKNLLIEAFISEMFEGFEDAKL